MCPEWDGASQQKSANVIFGPDIHICVGQDAATSDFCVVYEFAEINAMDPFFDRIPDDLVVPQVEIYRMLPVMVFANPDDGQKNFLFALQSNLNPDDMLFLDRRKDSCIIA